LCGWAKHFQRCISLRSAWRKGSGRREKLEVPSDAAKGGEVTCYDCEADLLALGTLQGTIVVWKLNRKGSKTLLSLQAVKSGRRVNKVYVRHNMVVAVQGGLLQVHTTKPSLALIYCKSLESPDPEKLFGGAESPSNDPAFVPQLTKQQLEARYLPRHLVTYPGLDMTVSTKGKPRLGLCLTGERSAHLYCLTTGSREGGIAHAEGEKIFKIGLVHTQAHSGLLYTVLQDLYGRYCGVMHSCQGERLWRLELWSVFDYDHSVFSVFTETGILIFGRQAGSEGWYPFVWQWQGWSYDGVPSFAHALETEYDMYLADCSQSALVTPRAMSFLFTSRDILVYTQKGHRGVAAFAHTWGPGVTGSRLWRANCLGEVGAMRTGGGSTGVPLVGSTVGQVVVTRQGTSLVVRDLQNGRRLYDIEGLPEEGALWGDDEKVVIVPKLLEDGVTLIQHWPINLNS